MDENRDIQKKINETFSRGVADFFDPGGVFKDKLKKKALGEYKEDIVVKFGVDPTRPDIHIGHAVILRKLRFLQDLGCKVIFLVGDFTAQIGDPTGKNKARPEMEQKEIEANMKTYLDQVGKILKTDKKQFSWIRNSEWFYNVTDIAAPKEVTLNTKVGGKESQIPINPKSFVGKSIYYEETRMQKTHLKKKQVVGVSLRGLLSTLRHITHAQLIERDMFQERIKSGKELAMHEMLYPVLQGIDSVMLERIYGSCDLEVGGTDQTFNMLLARDVMKMNKMKSQSVLSFELLVGTDGKEKMSKSLDNYVSIIDSPADMFGKIMSIPDNVLVSYFELCTYTPLNEVEKIKKELEKDRNPRDIKMRLASEIVSIYHGEEEKEKAKEAFVNTFQKKGVPQDIKAVRLKCGTSLSEVLLDEGLVPSKTEFHRLVEQGAINDMNTNKKVTDPSFQVLEDVVLRIGKKRFLKIEVTD